MRAWMILFGGLWLAAAERAWAQPVQNEPTSRPAAAARDDDNRGPADGDRPARPGGERRRLRPAHEPLAGPDAEAGRPSDDDARPLRPRPGEGPMGPGGPGLGPIGEMGRERVEQTMKFLKQHYPQMHERLQRLRESDPRGFYRQLMRIAPRMPELIDLIETRPELAKMMIEEHQLEMDIRDEMLRHARAKSDDMRAEAKQRLHELVSRQFDVRQNRLKAIIADLERELEQKKKALEERASKKDQIIELEVQRRLNPDI